MAIDEAVIPAKDHAHLYGDGLFEGIRIYGKKVFKLDEHLDRLFHGITYLGFTMPMTKEELRAQVLEVCAKADMEEAYIRLNVTRGTGLGLDPKSIVRANVMIMISKLNLYPQELHENGLRCNLSPVRVIPPDSLDPKCKCIGRYASNILAKQIANRQGVNDCLMLNHNGYICEGTGNNVFLVKGNVISTPHPVCGILVGITRNLIIEMARKEGYTVEETFLTVQDVYSADEAFFCGTATEVVPFVNLDGAPIGCGKPGPVTQKLKAAYDEIKVTGVPF